MAKKVLTGVKAPYNEATTIAFEAATAAADGFEYTLQGSDEYTFFVVQNTHGSAAKTITVKAPTNGGYAATDTDLVKSVASGAFAVIRVESARFANNDGTIKLIPESTDVKVVAVYR